MTFVDTVSSMVHAQDIAIVVPLPPEPKRYLDLIPDLLHSISAQTRKPDEIVIVYDGFNVKEFNMREIWDSHLSFKTGAWMRYFNMPARVGVPNAFNIGVAVAEAPLVVMVGADDILHPDCIARCSEAYERENKRDGFYWINVQWEDSEEPYNLPCGHAMVTSRFWKDIGGYPLESPGACDAALISMIWGSKELIAVGGEPLITVRRDTTTYTGSRDPRWTDIIIQQRELLVQLHKEKLMRESES